MNFRGTRLKDAFCLNRGESRTPGIFPRVWCTREFSERGLCSQFVQSNHAYNSGRGTLRGLHFQAAPCQEVKLVRCIRGSDFDVTVDFRSDSPTYQQWVGVELTAEQGYMLYIPTGFAHGYWALEDHTEVSYLVSQFYQPEADRGIRWDDPKVGVAWPLGEPNVIWE